MRRFILVFILLLPLCSCEKERAIFLRSYVTTYYETSISISGGALSWTPQAILAITMTSSEAGGEIYESPDTGGKGESAERFLQIATRNGDLSYNRKEYHWENMYGGRGCCADNFKAMHVVCLNAAWDDAHPAGSSLNDIAEVHFFSSAPYVRSGYTILNFGSSPRRLSELAEDDLAMIEISPRVFIDSCPPPGFYEMQVTMTTTEGEEKVARCTVDF